MNKYQIQITLRSPVCIARKRGVGNVIETLDYIPGSTIRGVLAMLYLKQYGSFDTSKRLWRLSNQKVPQEFDEIFTSDNVRFGNAYPDEARVIPFTATSCKCSRGFYTGSGYEDQHGVLDLLLESAKFETVANTDSNYKLPEKYDLCQYCSSVMDKFSGYYWQRGEESFRHISASKRLIARTAIMDSLETALPASLYTLEVLNEKKNGQAQKFIGQLEAKNTNSFNTLNTLLTQENHILRIGIAKSRGLGEVEMRLEKGQSYWQLWEKPLEQRLGGLNRKLEHLGGYFFSITLHSDAILLDEILRFKSTLEIVDLIDTLKALPQPQDGNSLALFKKTLSCFRLHGSWLATNLVTGWNIALRLPKEDEVAIAKGSVFLFKTNQALSDAQKTNLTQMLELLEQIGIGERRNEGFGRIRICDEFHWEKEEKRE